VKEFDAPDIDVVGPARIENHALGVTLPVANAKTVAKWISHRVRISGTAVSARPGVSYLSVIFRRSSSKKFRGK